MSRVQCVAPNQALKTIAPASVSTAAAPITSLPIGNHGATQGVILVGDPGNTGTIYIGDDTVTTANGIPIAASEKISLAQYDPHYLYAVGSTGTQTLRISLI